MAPRAPARRWSRRCRQRLQPQALAAAAVGHRDPAARDRRQRAKRVAVSEALARAGLLVPAIRPPTVPRGHRAAAHLAVRRARSSRTSSGSPRALNADRIAARSRMTVRDVVLLHGWGMTAAVWDELAARLAPRFRVHAPDLPGYGARAAVRALHARALAAARGARARRARCRVVGWSLGAQVALAWARARPRQVERLVLIGATPCFVQRAGLAVRRSRRRVLEAFGATLAADRAGDAAALRRAAGARRRRARRAWRGGCARALARGGAPDAAALAGGLAHPARQPICAARLRAIAQPALVVHGERDALVPPAAGGVSARARCRARALARRARRARTRRSSRGRGRWRRRMREFFDEDDARASTSARCGARSSRPRPATTRRRCCSTRSAGACSRGSTTSSTSRAAILDAGSGTGNAIPALLARYPRRARRRARPRARDGRARARGACGGGRRCPGCGRRCTPCAATSSGCRSRAGAVGLVWSNLALQWVNDLPRAFAEFHRVLAPGGLAHVQHVRPGHAEGAARAYAGADGRTHVHRFIDMHDIGDMLVAAGFADPVMDMEHVTLTYADVRALMRDLKAIGAHNATRGRPAGLSGEIAAAPRSSATTKRSAATASCPRRSKSSTATRGSRSRA